MTTDQRLARLERQCRLFKAGFALTAITLVTVLLVGAGQEQEKGKVLDEVRARKFVLVDGDGKTRATLGNEAYAGPTMFLLDEQGFERITLGLKKEGTPGILLHGKSGRTHAAFALLPSGSPGLRLSGGRAGAEAVFAFDGIEDDATLEETVEPRPRIALYEGKGKVTFKAPE